MLYLQKKTMKYIIFLFLPLITVAQTWNQEGNTIEGEITEDRFGKRVVSNALGNIVAISAPENDNNGEDSGHVKIFKNIDDVWEQIGESIEGDNAGDEFGNRITLNADGNVVAISSKLNDENGTNSGHVKVYENIQGVWIQRGTDFKGLPYDGLESVSLNAVGDILAIGSQIHSTGGFGAGYIRVFKYENDSWTQLGNEIYSGISSSKTFSFAMDIDSLGETVSTSYSNNDIRYIQTYSFDKQENIWIEKGEALEQENYVSQISLNEDGNRLIIGAGNISTVKVMQFVDERWEQLGDIITNDGSSFGSSVDINNSGDTIIVGMAAGAGSVSIYELKDGVEWLQIGETIVGDSSNDLFGSSVSLNDEGNIFVAGARLEDINGNNSGSARVFKLDELALSINNKLDRVETKFLLSNVIENDFLLLDENMLIEDITIFSLNGDVVFKKELKEEKDVNISQLSTGIYIINLVVNGNKVITHKIIKK